MKTRLDEVFVITEGPLDVTRVFGRSQPRNPDDQDEDIIAVYADALVKKGRLSLDQAEHFLRNFIEEIESATGRQR